MDLDIDIDNDSDSPTNTPPHPTTITPAARIAELNQIDHTISTLLTSAATATSLLSTQTSSQTLSSAQASFTAAANTYFSTLSAIEVRLRRQVYALEEAGLISAGGERDTRRGRTLNDEDGSGMRRGAGGPLEPSWLNARVGGAVEMGMKREVLTQARHLVEDTKESDGKVGGQDVDMTEGE